MDNLERWFANKMEQGNRNNLFLKYALCLVDSGYSYDVVAQKVYAFNKKLKDKLPDTELENTVLVTARKKYLDRVEEEDIPF